MLASLGFAAPSRFILAQTSAVPVDTELVLAVDVSYSMDPDEQQIQREGYIDAITSREFMAAIRAGSHGKVAITYFEWAGPDDQKIIVPWRIDRGAGNRRCLRRRDLPVRRTAAHRAPRSAAR